MTFFDDVGKLAIGTRVRFLGERIGQDAVEIYRAYGTNLQPKWFPVFYVLSQQEEGTVTAIAELIGHSHVSVSKMAGEMVKAGVLVVSADPKDRRATRLSLSDEGRRIARDIEAQYADIRAVVDEISSEANHDLWAAVAEWERLLQRSSLRDRVLAKKKQRESAGVQIEPYRSEYREAFRDLNEEWIRAHFQLETSDTDVLNNPEEAILQRGGFILVATLDGQALGVCALLKRDDLSGYELAKMAVSPQARGKNIGYLLGRAAIEKAQSMDAEQVYLESSMSLEPAIKLYQKLGFQKVDGPPSPYARCDIQMALKLK